MAITDNILIKEFLKKKKRKPTDITELWLFRRKLLKSKIKDKKDEEENHGKNK